MFFICSIIFLFISKKISRDVISIRKKYRIPNGKITYSDLNKPGKPFFSKRYMISGKPDYIVIENDKYIPIELKSGFSETPKYNHIIQLATYCQLLEDSYGSFVPYGRLVYGNSDFVIPFDPKLRFELQSVISKMKKSIRYGKVELNHNESGKCRNCSISNFCPDKLL